MSAVVSLDRLPVPVIAMGSPDDQPAMIVGPSLDSPLGPKVCVGAACSVQTGKKGLSFIAHLEPEEATQLAAKILEAAATVAAHQAQGARPS